MADHPMYAVTGAFGYSGQYIARRLLAAGHPVITLTNSAPRADQADLSAQVRAYPLQFDDRTALVHSLEGVSVLVNTYWVRFNYGSFSFAQAVVHSRTLFDAARAAGVERIVHVSITNPSEDSPLGYFSGKAQVERALRESGMSYAILRPAVLFGKEDILINNIAWILRHVPVFGVFGDGRYRLQPIYVDDLARLAIEQGSRRENVVINAIGPETFTYRELVQAIGAAIGTPRPLISIPPRLGYWVGMLIGRLMGDVTITWPEVQGLMAGLLYVDAPPAGTTALTTWASQHRDELGQQYASELARRHDHG